MEYEWKLTMDNGKEYLVLSKYSVASDFNKESYSIGDGGSSPMLNLITYRLSPKDSNGCKDVIIMSSKVNSVEFNF